MLGEIRTDKENSAPKPVAAVVKSPMKNGKKAFDWEKIEFKVNAMKVVELRKELRERGLDINGLKKILRTRLLEAMLKETQDECMMDSSSQASKTARQNDEELRTSVQRCETSGEVKATEIDKKDNEIDLTDAKVDDESMKTRNELKETEVKDSNRNQNVDAPAVVASATKSIQQPMSAGFRKVSAELKQGSSNIKAYWRSKVHASPGNIHVNIEPNEDIVNDVSHKKATSPLRGVLKNATKIVSASPVPPEVVVMTGADISRTSSGMKDNDDDESSPPSEVSDGSESKISGAKVRELVSKISGNATTHALSTTPGGSAGSSALSKSVKAKNDARMKRLAEIRQKVSIRKCLTFRTHHQSPELTLFHVISLVEQQPTRHRFQDGNSKRLLVQSLIIAQSY